MSAEGCGLTIIQDPGSKTLKYPTCGRHRAHSGKAVSRRRLRLDFFYAFYRFSFLDPKPMSFFDETLPLARHGAHCGKIARRRLRLRLSHLHHLPLPGVLRPMILVSVRLLFTCNVVQKTSPYSTALLNRTYAQRCTQTFGDVDGSSRILTARSSR